MTQTPSKMTEVQILAPDGEARAYTFTPEGAGPWPAVIFFMDAPAIRPALFEMCERLSSHGYFVLLPDMFWRAGPYAPINVAEVFADEAKRREIFGKLMGSTNPEKQLSDAQACIAWLEANPHVKRGRIGVTGYCMGAGIALRIAGAEPKVVAAAGFHGGRLATDAPDSPHLLEQADKLRAALTAAGVDNEITIYAGAKHGYTMSDLPVYSQPAAERHWTELFKLLDETLKEKVGA